MTLSVPSSGLECLLEKESSLRAWASLSRIWRSWRTDLVAFPVGRSGRGSFGLCRRRSLRCLEGHLSSPRRRRLPCLPSWGVCLEVGDGMEGGSRTEPFLGGCWSLGKVSKGPSVALMENNDGEQTTIYVPDGSLQSWILSNS